MYIYIREWVQLKMIRCVEGKKSTHGWKLGVELHEKKVIKDLFWCSLNCGTKSGKSKSILKNNWWTFNTKNSL